MPQPRSKDAPPIVRRMPIRFFPKPQRDEEDLELDRQHLRMVEDDITRARIEEMRSSWNKKHNSKSSGEGSSAGSHGQGSSGSRPPRQERRR